MKTVYFIISILLLGSCSRNGVKNNSSASIRALSKEVLYERTQLVLSPGEYMKWVNNRENNLIMSKTIDDIHFSILYKPTEYIVCKELDDKEIDKDKYENIKAQLGDLQYFDLRVQINDFNQEFLKYNLTSSAEYDRRVNYCAFQMQNDIKIIAGLDTISCSLFHFERAFDVVPYGQFILGFKKPTHSTGEETFVFYDKVFNKGIVKFTYDMPSLNHLPKLRTI